MTHDRERLQRITEAMSDRGFDALVCRLPHNVLMVSGYLPVLAQSLAVLRRDGEGALIVPEAELFFARGGRFTDVRTFSPVTLDYILSPLAASTPILAEVCRELDISGGVIGIEESSTTVAGAYLEFDMAGCETRDRWTQVLPEASLRDATDMLNGVASVKTPHEIERIHLACRLAEHGFTAAKGTIQPGIREVEVAAQARWAMEVEGTGWANIRRVNAWAFCMSGPRSADAYLPFQYSTNRRLESGEAVVVHVNCSADGYWTDMTRTFFVGEPAREHVVAYTAILNAWEKAVESIHTGVQARDVDSAARSVLEARGFGGAFVHGVGHGVGFKAIYHGERPIIHPQSDDVLRNDMVFNVEPAVYIPGNWGMRVCDLVAVRGENAKVLSDMHRDLAWATCV